MQSVARPRSQILTIGVFSLCALSMLGYPRSPVLAESAHRVPLGRGPQFYNTGLADLAVASRGVMWGIGASGTFVAGRILRGTNAGQSWTSVSPPGYTIGYGASVSVGGAATVTFLRVRPCAGSACYAGWAYATDSATRGTTSGSILRTWDGGSAWARLPGAGLNPRAAWRRPPILQFVNARDGWMMTYPCCKSGLIQMFDTTNGGLSWSLQTTMRPNVSTGIVAVTTFRFISAEDGWMSGVSMGRPWLAKTTDGGATWTSVYLIPPKELGHGLMETGPVTMEDRGTGVVPVTFGVAHQTFAFSPAAYKPSETYAPSGCPCEALYVTRNAGRAWAPTSVVTVHPATGGNAFGVLVEVLGGGVASMTDGIHLWATDNYGAKWTLRGGQRLLALQPVPVLRFLNPRDGWGISWGGVVDTIDGGRTWQMEHAFVRS